MKKNNHRTLRTTTLRTLALLIVAAAPILTTSAQKLIIVKSNVSGTPTSQGKGVYIDCTDMDENLIRTFANVDQRWQNVGGTSGKGLASADANKVVSRRFQIANADISATWGIAMGGLINSVDSESAITPLSNNGCTNYSEDGAGDPNRGQGKWRVPTKQELHLMYTFYLTGHLVAAKTFTGFAPFAATSYWSSTQANAYTAWYVTFSNGNTPSATKNNTFAVRCVRDVTPW